MSSNSSANSRKICLVILMNHPYPQNLPLLRTLYKDRFSSLLFLIPFHRCDDEDVVTVYRGSYTHAGYITDAREQLASIDCDYYIFLHDDVLLTPKLDEDSFHRILPLGPRDGYISRAGSTGTGMGHWTWFYGLLPKMLYPKSQLFGSGIEQATLRKYLPEPSAVTEALDRHGLAAQRYAHLVTDDFDDVARQPSRVLLHGLAAPLNMADPAQHKVDALSLAAEHRLVEAMQAAEEATQVTMGEHPDPDGKVELPMPMISSGYYADFYVVPKPCLDDYAHYIGVASAANLFVEVAAPTLLHVCCDRVWRADELGLDMSGFERMANPDEFRDPAFIAIHPFKFSTISAPDQQSQFLRMMDAVRENRPYDGELAIAGSYSVGRGLWDRYALRGWYPGEGWGRWASERVGVLQFVLPNETLSVSLELALRGPVSTLAPIFSGEVVVNGRAEPIEIVSTTDAQNLLVHISASMLKQGANQVEVHSDALVRPVDLDPSNGDYRQIGFGLVSLEFRYGADDRTGAIECA